MSKGLAEASCRKNGKASISGIVGHANLLLGERVEEVLEKVCLKVIFL